MLQKRNNEEIFKSVCDQEIGASSNLRAHAKYDLMHILIWFEAGFERDIVITKLMTPGHNFYDIRMNASHFYFLDCR